MAGSGPVIRVVPGNAPGPIYLLCKNGAHHRMRQGQAAQRPEVLSLLPAFLRQAVGAPDQETNPMFFAHPELQLPGKFFCRALLAAFSQSDGPESGRHAREKGFAFPGPERFNVCAAGSLRQRDFAQIQ